MSGAVQPADGWSSAVGAAAGGSVGASAAGAAGDPFDPALHEAVIHDTSSEVSVPTATTVLRQGFRRGDRVLRTAMVAVTDPASPPAAPEPEPETAVPTPDDEPAAG